MVDLADMNPSLPLFPTRRKKHQIFYTISPAAASDCYTSVHRNRKPPLRGTMATPGPVPYDISAVPEALPALAPHSFGRFLMRRSMHVCLFACLVGLMTMSGCQKVNEKKDYTLEPGGVQVMLVPAPNREQDVTVTVNASSPIDVYIASEKDAQDANDKVTAPKSPFASKKGIEKDTVTAKAPAKAGYGVVFLAGSKTKAGTKVSVELKAQ
jgi:hypothetical protein